MIRVDGLGSVKALFLYSAASEAAARADMQTVARLDPRITIKALFEIHELNLAAENRSTDAQASIYLQTGIHDSKQKRIINLFFIAQNDVAAARLACKRPWLENTLYHCRELSLEPAL